MNNLRLDAVASPSLRRQSACCLGRQFENVLIAVILATEGGRGEEEEGLEEVTPCCLLSHSHWRVLPVARAIAPGTAGGFL